MADDAGAMTDDEFKGCLDKMRRSRRDFAKEIGARPNAVDLWASGKISVPPPVAAWLRRAAAWFDENPAPTGGEWRRRGRGVTPKPRKQKG